MWSQIVVFYFVGLSYRHHLSCILGRLFFFEKVLESNWSYSPNMEQSCK